MLINNRTMVTLNFNANKKHNVTLPTNDDRNEKYWNISPADETQLFPTNGESGLDKSDERYSELLL